MDVGRGAEGDGRGCLMVVSDRWFRLDVMGVVWSTVLALSQGGKGGRTAEAVWYGCWVSAWVSICPACAC